LAASPCAEALDLKHAVIRLQPNAGTIEKKAATMIAEEVEKRTQFRLQLNAPKTRP